MLLFSGKKIKVSLSYNGSIVTYEIDQHQNLKYIKHLFAQANPGIDFTPIIALESNKVPFSINDELTQLVDISKNNPNLNLLVIKPETQPKKQIKPPIKCKCSNEVEFFCFKCQTFICHSCNKKNHINHYIISITKDTIEKSIKLFTISLNADISNEITSTKKNNDYFHDIMLERLREWRDELISKLNIIEKNILSVLQYKKEFDREIKKYSNELEAITCKLNKNIKNVFDLIEENKNNLDLSHAETYLGMLHENMIDIRTIIKKEKNKSLNYFEKIKQIESGMSTIDDNVTNINDNISYIFNDLNKKYNSIENEHVLFSSTPSTRTKRVIHFSSHSLAEGLRKLSTQKIELSPRTEESTNYYISDRNEKNLLNHRFINRRNINNSRASALPKINITFKKY